WLCGADEAVGAEQGSGAEGTACDSFASSRGKRRALRGAAFSGAAGGGGEADVAVASRWLGRSCARRPSLGFAWRRAHHRQAEAGFPADRCRGTGRRLNRIPACAGGLALII